MTGNQMPLASKASLKQYCRQEAETAALANAFAASLEQWISQNSAAHMNISLAGDLGSGKTTFARYLIQSLGHEGKVKSPTYTLCESYPISKNGLPFTVHHFDLYRMRDPLEWQEAGFAELFDVSGFCIIEWPEKAEGTLPLFDIQIQLEAGNNEDERLIAITALSEQGKSLITSMVGAE
jgi:tRNA threonylcarbamoyladenosine biosynthesis protein TsaE